MSVKRNNAKTLTQLFMATLLAGSLIACSDESSSNSDSSDSGTRTVTTAGGEQITIESDGDNRTVRLPQNNTINVNCDGNDTIIFEGEEIDVCS